MSQTIRPVSAEDLQFSDQEDSQTLNTLNINSVAVPVPAPTSSNKKNKKKKDPVVALTAQNNGGHSSVTDINTTEAKVTKPIHHDASSFGPASSSTSAFSYNNNNVDFGHDGLSSPTIHGHGRGPNLRSLPFGDLQGVNDNFSSAGSARAPVRPAMPKVTTFRDALGQTLTPNKTTVAVATITTTAGIALTLAGGVIADKANQFLSAIAPELTPDSDAANAVADAQSKLNQAGPALLIGAQVLAALNVVPSAVRSLGWNQLTTYVSASTKFKTALYNMDAILGRLTQGAGAALITKGILDQQNGDSIYGAAETIVGLGALKVGTALANLNVNKRNWVHGKNNQTLFHNAQESEKLTGTSLELSGGNANNNNVDHTTIDIRRSGMGMSNGNQSE